MGCSNKIIKAHKKTPLLFEQGSNFFRRLGNGSFHGLDAWTVFQQWIGFGWLS
jgi:hypothetical protein